MTSAFLLDPPISPPTSPNSLLRPVNPAFDDLAPSGGILINRRRPSDLSINRGVVEVTEAAATGSGVGMHTSASVPMSGSGKPVHLGNDSMATKTSMKRSTSDHGSRRDGILQTSLPTSPGLSSQKSDAHTLPHTTKIRFAPLPSPQRQRSLSTGRNINMETTMMSDGTRIAKLATTIPGKGSAWAGDPYDEHAIDDDDEEEEEAVKRSWRNMGMGSWTRTSSGSVSGTTTSYTMRLLKPLRSPMGNDTDSMDKASMAAALEGSPLKKSVSTGGLIGSSPFRSSAEKARKSSFLSSASSVGPSSKRPGHLGHRASTSYEQPDFSSLSSSLGGQQSYTANFPTGSLDTSVPVARPVKMLNGRVYGKRSADEAAARRMSAEPAFVEWGGMMGEKNTGGLGSNQTQRTMRTDRDEGGGGGMGSNSVIDEDDDGSGIAWARRRREARERLRRESEVQDKMQAGLDAESTVRERDESPHGTSTAQPLEALPTINVAPPRAQDEEHLIQAVFVPGSNKSDELDSPSGRPTVSPSDIDFEEVSDSSDDDDDDDDDRNEYSDDDDEEDLIDEEESKRTTSSAAGVEVMVQRKQ